MGYPMLVRHMRVFHTTVFIAWRYMHTTRNAKGGRPIFPYLAASELSMFATGQGTLQFLQCPK
jgi:hypothetical protein